jgi:protein-disulfide isomerase
MTTVRPPQPLLDQQAVELVDHVLPASAKVVLVEYGDYEASATTQASGAIRQILEEVDGIVFVYRHFPDDGRPPQEMPAAQAAEAAGAQDWFWPMHDALLDRGTAKSFAGILHAARRCGIPDYARLVAEVNAGEHLTKIARDMALATEAGITTLPAFVIDGHLYDDPAGLLSLRHEVQRRRGSYTP